MVKKRIRAEIINCGYGDKEYFEEIYEMVLKEVCKDDFILCESYACLFAKVVMNCCYEVESKYE